MDEAKGLHPNLAEAVTKLLAEAKARGLSVGLHSGVRTFLAQKALYELGRSQVNPDGATPSNPRGNIVTKTAAGFSDHNYGFAADIVYKDEKGNWTWDKSESDWEKLGIIGEMFGLEWGGRWKMKDYPHFQLKKKLTIEEYYKLLGQIGMDRLWELI